MNITDYLVVFSQVRFSFIEGSLEGFIFACLMMFNKMILNGSMMFEEVQAISSNLAYSIQYIFDLIFGTSA